MIQLIYPTIKINHMILISTNNLLTEFQVMSINLKKDLLNISMQLLLHEFFKELLRILHVKHKFSIFLFFKTIKNTLILTIHIILMGLLFHN